METCGDHGGTKEDGSPCGQPAGWGTDLDSGRCRDHPVQDEGTESDLPEPPEELPDGARKFWRFMVDSLWPEYPLEPADLPLLEQAAKLDHAARECWEQLQAEGYVTEDHAHGGTEKRHPAWVIFNQSVSQFRKLAKQLGLGPNARQRIDWPDAEPEPTEMDRILDENPRHASGE